MVLLEIKNAREEEVEIVGVEFNNVTDNIWFSRFMESMEIILAVISFTMLYKYVEDVRRIIIIFLHRD
jgi:hypothetical protein